MTFTTIVTNIERLRINKMDAQQLLDNIIKPTLEYMGANYNSKNARMLLLSTAAIESKCGYYIKQIGGPALGIWQMESTTHEDIWDNCDAIQEPKNGQGCVLSHRVHKLMMSPDNGADNDLIVSPMYACAMARLKYSMDPKPLPDYHNIRHVYDYYKRIYNTPLGASTYAKFKQAWLYHKLDAVVL